ncbi:MAG: hypothetical protein ACM3QZ_14555 [Solirubrobacterales bacterium]
MKPNPCLIECTMRDGNYSVDFKFTEKDTRMVTRKLAEVGFRWIEVGHGLGLGGNYSGKGSMPASDEAMIRAAREGVGDQARIGMFFIPGIARLEHLKLAKEAGLDFVRIGIDAPRTAEALPYLTKARELGLIPCLNMMKSYSLSPEQFADKAAESSREGAEIVYFVDSSGSMLPQDIARYIEAAREKTDCELGFHGHNNLMMAAANSIQAFQSGARFIDATLFGLGRSAGNTPTEVILAIFDLMGISTGIDLFAVMNIGEAYVWPLVSQMSKPTMTSVAMGYGRFHSGFLPAVADAASRHDCDVRKLLVAMASIDCTEIIPDVLEAQAVKLAGSRSESVSNLLVDFQGEGFTTGTIRNSLDSVESLIEGLVVTSAKRPGSMVALLLAPSETQQDGLVLAEYLLTDSQAVIGKVTFGSIEILEQTIAACSQEVSVFLLDQHSEWARSALDTVVRSIESKRVMIVRDKELRASYITKVMDVIAGQAGRENLLIYRSDPMISRAVQIGLPFEHIFRMDHGERLGAADDNRIISLGSMDDLRDLNIHFNAVLCSTWLSREERERLERLMVPAGRILISTPGFWTSTNDEDKRLTGMNTNLAYVGVVEQNRALWLNL